jgi:Tfp pilus assembly PilM family ATPase
MARSHPPDVLVLDTDGFLHARMARGKGGLKIAQAKTYRFAADTFSASLVTPQLANESSFDEALRRLRMETGKWDRVSVLLPDSWFRINIVDLPSLPEKNAEAMQVVRWSLKRTLPIPPEELRVAYTVLSRSSSREAKVMVLSAMDATLTAIERLLAKHEFETVLIEPVGINIWNAISTKEDAAVTGDRLFVYVREQDFTTAVFRGAQPLFIRSRNLSRDRTLDQEMRLSANYLRDALNVDKFTACYVAGERASTVHETLASEFQTSVRDVRVRDYVSETQADVAGFDAELTACTGVFTG